MTDDLADGWQVWSDADDRLVLAYRPDVFNGGDFPPPCLPTIYVTRGSRTRRPGVRPTPRPEDPWHVTLFLEPEVKRDPEFHDAREAAFEAAFDLAERFAAGEIDYRGLYQVPREAYFERLDDLTGGGRDA